MERHGLKIGKDKGLSKKNFPTIAEYLDKRKDKIDNVLS